jgi:superoxide dismutase, Fe-Mn family
MATTSLTDTHHTRNRTVQQARAVDHLERIGGLSRIVDRDIEILKMNLVQCHYGRDETWASAWARLETAWETVRSELVDDSASSRVTEDLAPPNAAAVAMPQPDAPMAVAPTVPLVMRPLKWVTGALAPAISSKTKQFVGWAREPARRTELRAAALRAWRFAHSAALAGVKHVNNGWLWLEAQVIKQTKTLESACARLEGNWKAMRAERAKRKSSLATTEVDSLASYANGVITQDDVGAAGLPAAPSFDRVPRDIETFEHRLDLGDITHLSGAWVGDSGQGSDATWEGSAHARLESAKETVKSKLADGKPSPSLIEGASRPIRATGAMPQLDEPMATSPDAPFVLKPLPWVLGALSPVISSRTMLMHHGCHYSQCVELANRLSRNHKELAGKNPLEIMAWARVHARGTELLSTASEAWNHWFFWQCLTPWKKRPNGELRKALYRAFGDFTNFADKFALAGATHVGSGWLWLIANGRKQVRILTTSDADCPEARGYTCLLAIDLWEHAYYLDHQGRRREYLDALIDRRLDWEFAELRYRLVLDAYAPRKASRRSAGRKRSRQHPRQRKPAASRR